MQSCCGSSEETFVTAKRKFTISSLLSPRSLVAFLVGLLSCRIHIAEIGGEATISLGQTEHSKITQRKFTISSLLSPRSRVAVLVGLLSCH